LVSAIQISSNARLALGHTPTIYLDPQQTTPDVRDNRCNVDTGAGMSIAEGCDGRQNRSSCGDRSQ
jgi:hypothetical protein